MRPDPSPAGIPCWPLLAVVILLIGWAVAILGPRDAAPCLACPGHVELASECLCYHVPITPDSLPH